MAVHGDRGHGLHGPGVPGLLESHPDRPGRRASSSWSSCGGWFAKTAGPAPSRPSHMQSLIAQMTDVLISIKPLKAMAREKQSDVVLTDTTRRLNRALQKQVLSKAALGSFQEPLTIVFLVLCLYIALVVLEPVPDRHHRHGLFHRQNSQAGRKNPERVREPGRVRQRLLVAARKNRWGHATPGKCSPERCKPAFASAIRMDSVSFSYDDRAVLDDVSLELPAGSFSALLGPSGSGKTTIADLLTGLLRPQKGDIWIDGAPLSQIDIGSWREMIGYVPQENLLMHDTVLQEHHAGRGNHQRSRMWKPRCGPPVHGILSSRCRRACPQHRRRARQHAIRWAAPAHRHRARAGETARNC